MTWVSDVHGCCTMNWHSASNRHLVRSSSTASLRCQPERPLGSGWVGPASRTCGPQAVFVALSGASMSRRVLSTALDSFQVFNGRLSMQVVSADARLRLPLPCSSLSGLGPATCTVSEGAQRRARTERSLGQPQPSDDVVHPGPGPRQQH
jgi:hypothetical protein